MSKDILDNLFGSRIRVKVLKFFFRNYPGEFGVSELAKRIQESHGSTKKEIDALVKLRLIKKNTHLDEPRRTKYALNRNFEFFTELKALILKSSPAEKNRMTRRILTLGRVKLAVVSGVFLNNASGTDNSVADLFIVGDDINKEKLRSFVRSLEAEVGREIKLSIMDKDEFDYRYGMFDRFVRVLLESPHEKIINKIGL